MLFRWVTGAPNDSVPQIDRTHLAGRRFGPSIARKILSLVGGFVVLAAGSTGALAYCTTQTTVNSSAATYSPSSQNVFVSAHVTRTGGTAPGGQTVACTSGQNVNISNVTFSSPAFTGPVSNAAPGSPPTGGSSGVHSANAVIPAGLAAGTYTVTADYNGSTGNTTSTGTASLVITQASQTVTFAAPANQTYGSTPPALSASASSGLTVSFASTTPAVCTVSGSTVTLVAAGTCSLTASQSGDNNYAAATNVQRSFSVTPAAQTITFPAVASQSYATSPTLSATASSGLTVAFASTTAPVCTVSGSTVTLVSTGTCSITASQGGNGNFSAASNVVRSFAVTPASQTISFASLSNQAYGATPPALSASASSGLSVSFASTTASVCTVSSDTVALLATGTCSITASQSGNVNYAAASTVAQSFAVTPASQTISFASLSDQVYGSTPPALSASASSGLSVSFGSTTTSVCTVSGNSVTLVSGGTCSITASQPGNANYAAAADVAQSFAVTPASQTISFASLSTQVYGSTPPAFSASSSSGLSVSFASTTASVCAVSGSAVTLVSTGTCSITASQSGNANYAAAPDVARSFAVTPSSQTITFAALSNQAYGSTPPALSGSASSGLSVSFASTTTPVCTVSGTAVTLVSAGTCSITASQGGNANYAAAPDVAQSFAVTPASQTISFASRANQVYGSTPPALSASASSGLSVSFASTTTPVCTVSGSNVTLVSTGTCSITASQGGNANYAAAPDVAQSFSVTPSSQTITFAALSNQAYGSTPPSLSASASSGLSVSFASTTASVCTVAGSTVTLVSAGTCSITASQGGNANYAAAPDVAQSFTVTPASQTISFASLSNQAYGSTPPALSASASSGLSVSFASTTASVCTVSGNAVTLISAGTCSITASQSGNANYAAAPDVAQSFAVTPASQTISFASLSNQAYGSTPPALSASASSGLPVSFASSTAPVCTVSGTTVTLVSAGTCMIAASQGGNANYSSAPDVARSFSVTPSSQTITFASLASQVYGSTPPALSASASSGLPVSFVSTTAPVCTVSGNTVTLVSAGTCSVTASQGGNSNYSAASDVAQSFAVTPASQTITFAPLSNQAYGSTPPALSASASSGLPVSFASTTAAVCTMSGNTVTLVAAGTCSITATQSGNGDYVAASNVVRSFAVTPSSQAITFAALSNQAYGSTPPALSASASSGLPVSFVSTTAPVCTVSGSVVTLVSAGTCSITASQSGNANYAAAPDIAQSFTVTPSSQTITFASLSNQAYGSTPPGLSASASSGLSVSFASTTASVCAVSGNTVTLVSAGTCSITASQPGNANYAAASDVARSFAVTPSSQTISFASLSSQSYGSTPPALSASASSGLTVSFATTTAPVCTVSGNAVTLVSAGTCSITASQPGNANYAAAPEVARSFAVTPSSQSISFAFLSNQAYGSTPPALSASASSGLSVSFASSTAPVCTVSGNIVTLVSAGTCSITASQPGNANYAAANNVSQSFAVTSAGQTISFASLSNQVYGSTPPALSASATSGLPVSFASSTASVCTVSGNAVTLASVGTCTLTASQGGNANYAAASDVARSFSVTPSSQTISFASLSNQSYGSTPPALSASANSGLPVSFASTTAPVCTVSGSTVTLVSAGMCSITASQGGNTNYAAATNVSQSFAITSASQAISFASLSNQAYGSTSPTLSASASSGLPVSFASTTAPVCTVSGSTVTLVSAGMCSITASQGGNTNYAAATSVSQSFAVMSASQTISFASPSNQAYGSTPPALSASASSGLPVSFASTTAPVCTVSGSTVTLVSAGMCSITASQGGNANYAAATNVSQSFAVTSASQTISFASLSNQSYGSTPSALSATSSSGLPVSFASTTAPVCTVSGSTVTLVAAGSCSIAASQPGNANFAAAPVVMRTFSVLPAGNGITFSPLADTDFTSTPPRLVATALSGQLVTFTSTTPSVCSIIAGPSLQFVAAGNCSVTASQDSAANFAAATPVVRTFAVRPGANVIAFASVASASLSGSPPRLNASTSSGLPITFSSNSSAVCTVTSSGTLTLLSAGTCSITASQVGNAMYGTASPVTQTFAVTQGVFALTVSSSQNPSAANQAVTFTAQIIGAGTAAPNAAVVFKDGGRMIGSSAIVGRSASVTVPSLSIGSHAIVAMFAGDGVYEASASAPMMQAVQTPADSVALRAMQSQATRAAAQMSGAMTANAVDTAISEGFSDNGAVATPSANGVHINLGGTSESAQDVTGSVPLFTPGSASAISGIPGAQAYAAVEPPQIPGNPFGAIDRRSTATKAAAAAGRPRDWLVWADVRYSSLAHFSPNTGALNPLLSTTNNSIYGTQINTIFGITRRLTSTFLVGALAGYETFDYRSDTLAGRLKGAGLTAGAYLGWKLVPTVRFDAMASYSGVSYDGTSGQATGSFKGSRLLLSTGLTGSYDVGPFTLQPGAKIYALWERQAAYVDSLGSAQESRTYMTGRASGGMKVTYAIDPGYGMTFAPYAGAYMDYYLNGDSASINAGAASAQPLFQGWSARALGGVAARVGEATVTIEGERGGIGGAFRTWAAHLGANLSF